MQSCGGIFYVEWIVWVRVAGIFSDITVSQLWANGIGFLIGVAVTALVCVVLAESIVNCKGRIKSRCTVVQETRPDSVRYAGNENVTIYNEADEINTPELTARYTTVHKRAHSVHVYESISTLNGSISVHAASNGKEQITSASDGKYLKQNTTRPIKRSKHGTAGLDLLVNDDVGTEANTNPSSDIDTAISFMVDETDIETVQLSNVAESNPNAADNGSSEIESHYFILEKENNIITNQTCTGHLHKNDSIIANEYADEKADERHYFILEKENLNVPDKQTTGHFQYLCGSITNESGDERSDDRH